MNESDKQPEAATDQVFTGWAREWWPDARVYSIQASEEPERWFIENGPGKETIELDSGGRLSARLALHVLIAADLARDNIGPDATRQRTHP